MVKLGCELNTLLESANSVSGSLTQRDVILICGGSNDFNTDKCDQLLIISWSSLRQIITPILY